MKLLKSTLLGLVAGVLLASAALAQVNYVPQIGVASATIRQKTYSATSVALVPAASATDIFCINGSTSKTVKIRRFIISGTAGTAITTPILVNLNHSLDTGGTAATSLAAPVAVGYNPGNSTSTVNATTAYTANPTVNDASPSLLAAFAPTFPVTTTAGTVTQILAGSSVDFYDQGLDIPIAATVVQQICLNLNGKSISSGLLNITAEWTEE